MRNFLKNPVKRVLAIFVAWRLILFFLAVLVVRFLPYGNDGLFLGGGMGIYPKAPDLFAWANFDGEHYLSIAVFGYKDLQQAFFPVYPKLIALFSYPFSFSTYSHYFGAAVVGLLISNLSLIFALVLLSRLLRLDYSEEIAFWTIVFILLFPTSFFLSAVYSESLFLLLTFASFYCCRKKKWLLSGMLAALAAGTRIIGILIFPALLIEIYQQKESLKKAWGVFFAPLGLIMYMVYLRISIGDPIAFYHLQKVVGEQHQYGIVLLPQVFYRYLKILFTANLPISLYQTEVLEFLTGILFLFLPVYGYFKKIRLSYIFYALAGMLMPSIPGSFSSLPRYVLVLFPSFLVMTILIMSLPKWGRVIVAGLLGVILSLETALFLRGYWVS